MFRAQQGANTKFKYKNLKQMRTIDNVADLIRHCDMFGSNELLRFKSSSSYKTPCGGMATLSLLIFLVAYSSVMGSNVQVPTTVTGQDSIENFSEEQANLTVSPTLNPLQKFTFAVGLAGINLNSGKRYFNISLRQTAVIKLNKAQQLIPLQACTKSQWDGINPTISQKFQDLNLQQWLCPPAGTTIKMQGRFTSNTFKYATVVVSKCEASDKTKTQQQCYSDAEIKDYLKKNKQFMFNFYYINPTINFNGIKGLDYYLEDKNYFNFDLHNGITADLFFDSFQLNSQDNILPFKKQPLKLKGLFTTQQSKFQSMQLSQDSQEYVKFHFRQSFNKIYFYQISKSYLDIIAYIGGIFTILYLIMRPIFQNYNQRCYELEKGSTLLKTDQPPSKQQNNYNFFKFVYYLLAEVLSMLNSQWSKAFKSYKHYIHECRMQLDVGYLLERINTADILSKILLSERQQALIHLCAKPSLHDSKLDRAWFRLTQKLYNRVEIKAKQIFVPSQQKITNMEQILTSGFHERKKAWKGKSDEERSRQASREVQRHHQEVHVKGNRQKEACVAYGGEGEEKLRLLSYKDEIEMQLQGLIDPELLTAFQATFKNHEDEVTSMEMKREQTISNQRQIYRKAHKRKGQRVRHNSFNDQNKTSLEFIGNPNREEYPEDKRSMEKQEKPALPMYYAT